MSTKAEKYDKVATPYSGELFDLKSLKAEDELLEITPFDSDTECSCVIEVESGERVPDFVCSKCNGTGKYRTLSLYEKAIIAKANRGS